MSVCGQQQRFRGSREAWGAPGTDQRTKSEDRRRSSGFAKTENEIAQLNERADPNKFIFRADGTICRKGASFSNRNENSSFHSKRSPTRSSRRSLTSTPRAQAIRQQNRYSRGHSDVHEERNYNYNRDDDDISIALTQSICDQVQSRARARARPGARIGVNPRTSFDANYFDSGRQQHHTSQTQSQRQVNAEIPCSDLDESADPDSFYIDANGIVRPKLLKEDSLNFNPNEEEDPPPFIIWPTRQQPSRPPTFSNPQRVRTPSRGPPPPRQSQSPPPPLPPRLQRRSMSATPATPPHTRIASTLQTSLEISPASVVFRHDMEELCRWATIDDQRNSIRRECANIKKMLAPRACSNTSNKLIAPFCILDSRKQALNELLSATKKTTLLNLQTPRFDPTQMTYENLLLLDSAPPSAAERAKKGLSSHQLQTIHSILIQTPPDGSNESLPQCSICQEEFHSQDPGLCLPHCQHIFHGDCIAPWFIDHSFCPNCRRNVV